MPEGRLLDVVVALKVMGWTRTRRDSISHVTPEEAELPEYADYAWNYFDEQGRLEGLPWFHRRMEAAWPVAVHQKISIVRDADTGGYLIGKFCDGAFIWNEGGVVDGRYSFWEYVATAKEVPAAICRVALQVAESR